jgi:hypothetical protein
LYGPVPKIIAKTFFLRYPIIRVIMKGDYVGKLPETAIPFGNIWMSNERS